MRAYRRGERGPRSSSDIEAPRSTTASSSSTRWASSRLPSSTPCASPWRRASSGSAAVAERVAAARDLAVLRDVRANAHIPAGRLDEVAPLSPGAWRILEFRLRSGTLSARGLHRVRRVARTVADLQGVTGEVGEEHLCSALELRTDVDALQAAS